MSILLLQTPYYKVIHGLHGCCFPWYITQCIIYLYLSPMHCLLSNKLCYGDVNYVMGLKICMTRNSAVYQLIVHNQNPENCFLPRMCIAALKQCRGDQGLSIPPLQQHQFPGLCLKSWVGSSLLTGKILPWKQDLTSVLIPLCVWVPITTIKLTLRGWRWKTDLFSWQYPVKGPRVITLYYFVKFKVIGTTGGHCSGIKMCVVLPDYHCAEPSYLAVHLYAAAVHKLAVQVWFVKLGLIVES